VNRFRTVAITALAGLALVACSSSASSSQGAGASQAASQAAQQSQGAGASQGGPEPSFGAGVVAELEALIPDKVGDITMQKSSYRGNDYLVSSNADPETVKFLNDVGVSPSDIAIAIGFGFNADYSSGASVIVIRASGADSNKLVTAFKNNMQANASSPIEWTSTSLGGKQVESSGGTDQTSYLYAHGDTVFIVGANDAAVAGQILSGLP
jgi:hypothetical protein